MFLNGFSPSAENDKPIQPKVGIKKKNYDATRKFQEKWATKFPWAKKFVGEDGTLHIVKCRVCTKIERKNKILATKWDSFCKHASHQKALRNIGFDVKKGISFTPSFVSMLRTREHLHLAIGRLLMPNWHIGW
jgi:hypothetical protein